MENKYSTEVNHETASTLILRATAEKDEKIMLNPPYQRNVI